MSQPFHHDTHAEKPSKIPEFRLRQEEDEFRDAHVVTDYLDELRPVEVRFAPNLSSGTTVRLEPADREDLARIAAERGVGPSPLARMWIKEREHEAGARERKHRRLWIGYTP